MSSEGLNKEVNEVEDSVNPGNIEVPPSSGGPRAHAGKGIMIIFGLIAAAIVGAVLSAIIMPGRSSNTMSQQGVYDPNQSYASQDSSAEPDDSMPVNDSPEAAQSDKTSQAINDGTSTVPINLIGRTIIFPLSVLQYPGTIQLEFNSANSVIVTDTGATGSGTSDLLNVLLDDKGQMVFTDVFPAETSTITMIYTAKLTGNALTLSAEYGVHNASFDNKLSLFYKPMVRPVN